MPEIGDTVQILFPTEDEHTAYASASLRQADTSRTVDPRTKYLRTADGKEIKLAEREIVITANDGITFVRINEDSGVEIRTNRDIRMIADGNISMNAGGEINLRSAGEFRINSGRSLRVDVTNRIDMRAITNGIGITARNEISGSAGSGINMTAGAGIGMGAGIGISMNAGNSVNVDATDDISMGAGQKISMNAPDDIILALVDSEDGEDITEVSGTEEDSDNENTADNPDAETNDEDGGEEDAKHEIRLSSENGIRIKTEENIDMISEGSDGIAIIADKKIDIKGKEEKARIIISEDDSGVRITATQRIDLAESERIGIEASESIHLVEASSIHIGSIGPLSSKARISLSEDRGAVEILTSKNITLNNTEASFIMNSDEQNIKMTSETIKLN